MTDKEKILDILQGNIVTKADGIYLHESMFDDVADLILEALDSTEGNRVNEKFENRIYNDIGKNVCFTHDNTFIQYAKAVRYARLQLGFLERDASELDKQHMRGIIENLESFVIPEAEASND